MRLELVKTKRNLAKSEAEGSKVAEEKRALVLEYDRARAEFATLFATYEAPKKVGNISVITASENVRILPLKFELCIYIFDSPRRKRRRSCRSWNRPAQQSPCFRQNVKCVNDKNSTVSSA